MGTDRESLVRRAVLVNSLGLIAKLGIPAVFLAITWLFGASTFGRLVVALTAVQWISTAVAAGWMDAATVYVARALGDSTDFSADDGAGHRMAACVLRYTLVTAIAAAFVIHVLAGPIISRVFAPYTDLVPGIILLGWAIIPESISRWVAGICKAKFDMQPELWLLGVGVPASQLVTAFVVSATGGGIQELIVGFVIGQFVVCACALLLVRRVLSLSHVFKVISSARSREVLRFGLAQGMNLGANKYASRVDVLMLAAFGIPAWMVGWYSTAAMITHELRQVRIVFTTAFTPLVARYHAASERAAMSRTLTMLTRQAGTLGLFVAAASGLFVADILRLIEKDYTGSMFAAVLVAVPAISCLLGFSGTFLVASGRSVVNLVNAVFVALLNMALNAVWIPMFGLLGAALATLLAQLALVTLENLELYKLEKVSFDVRSVWWLFIVGGMLVLAVAGALEQTFWVRLAVASVFVVVGLALTLTLRRQNSDVKTSQ